MYTYTYTKIHKYTLTQTRAHIHKYLDNALSPHGGGNLHKASGIGAKDVVALPSVLLGGYCSGSVWTSSDNMKCHRIYKGSVDRGCQYALALAVCFVYLSIWTYFCIYIFIHCILVHNTVLIHLIVCITSNIYMHIACRCIQHMHVHVYTYEHIYTYMFNVGIFTGCIYVCILSIYTDIHKSSQIKRKTYGWASWCLQVVCQPHHGSTQGAVSFVTFKPARTNTASCFCSTYM